VMAVCVWEGEWKRFSGQLPVVVNWIVLFSIAGALVEIAMYTSAQKAGPTGIYVHRVYVNNHYQVKFLRPLMYTIIPICCYFRHQVLNIYVNSVQFVDYFRYCRVQNQLVRWILYLYFPL
jgi:hypothetical protein